MDVSTWKEQAAAADATAGQDQKPADPQSSLDPAAIKDPELEAFRRRLEGLL
jgi:hypothetical protein